MTEENVPSIFVSKNSEYTSCKYVYEKKCKKYNTKYNKIALF